MGRAKEDPLGQELGFMYDYLAKIILLGPSGSGKTSLLYRYLHNKTQRDTHQTIGLEFASKIVKIGTGPSRRRIKLQLWDTAGTERFQAISKSYYRGAAGAILVYDISSRTSFNRLSSFLQTFRSEASPHASIILIGNKADLDGRDSSAGWRNGEADGPDGYSQYSESNAGAPSSSLGGYSDAGSVETIHAPTSARARNNAEAGSLSSLADSSSFYPTHDATPALSLRNPNYMAGTGARGKPAAPVEGRQVSNEDSIRWARSNQIPVVMEASAESGLNVDDLFTRIALMILTKIETGEIDPNDLDSGVRYGDTPIWDSQPAGSNMRRRAGADILRWPLGAGGAQGSRGGCC